MAKLTVQFKDGEIVEHVYSDYAIMMSVIRFVVGGITVDKVTIDL